MFHSHRPNLDSVLCYSREPSWPREAHEYIRFLERGRLHRDNFLAKVSSGANVHPSAIIEEGCYIANGTFIGPNCKISHGSFVSSGCQLGFCVEIYGSILLNNTKIAHVACISHSIIGPNCNLAFGFVTATRSIESRPIRVKLSEDLSYFSSERHHGCVIMDGVQSGVHCSVMPGATIGNGAILYPNRAYWFAPSQT